MYTKVLRKWIAFLRAKQADTKNQAGIAMLAALLSILVVFLVLGLVIPQIWPLIATSGGAVANMTGTDSGTDIIQAFWPIGITLAGLAVGIGVIIFIIKKVQG